MNSKELENDLEFDEDNTDYIKRGRSIKELASNSEVLTSFVKAEGQTIQNLGTELYEVSAVLQALETSLSTANRIDESDAIHLANKEIYRIATHLFNHADCFDFAIKKEEN
ncbi:hypothetical protein B1745_04385 [Lactobacillus amylolyticus]|uniref:hypothetical protein n=1 Tax=Lactobacillus amylolyticus TaxID=83683 RepID=UPI0009BBC7D6|nr:hypothetical protein [Lactobacillus amylolyticus]ARD06918.1 hypothetical protein B1745_04385 [Lactobacillus amylolyticus]